MTVGPSSEITKAVIEVFAVRFLQRPTVLYLSESGNKVVARDENLAASIGLAIEADRDRYYLIPFAALWISAAIAIARLVKEFPIARIGAVVGTKGYCPLRSRKRRRTGRAAQRRRRSEDCGGRFP